MWRPVIATLVAFIFAAPLSASDAQVAALSKTIKELENTLDARIGVFIRDTASDWNWGYRQSERFLMASTFKAPLCGAVLAQISYRSSALNNTIRIVPADILPYAPITKNHVGDSMSLGALCEATLDKSDNTAANLLLRWLGGPAEVTTFLRELGDTVTRLDRIEPDVNLFAPDDPRDTTTPEAMVKTWNLMLLGGGLPPEASAQLKRWMQTGSVTGALIRPAIPAGWHISDKSGGGRHHTRNIVAMITPTERAPFIVAIYISDTYANWNTRNNAVAQIGAALIDLIEAR